jgi:predicted Ser/Thr protein kinase
MDRGRNILFGKLAIARKLLSPPQATECFGAIGPSGSGRAESLWEVAVSRGYMTVDRAREIVQAIDSGIFTCRNNCGWRQPLRDFPPDAALACPKCQGSLGIEAGSAARPATPPPLAETSRAIPGQGNAYADVSRAGGGLPRVASDTNSRAGLTRAESLASGEFFGDYKIVKRLGKGGMGVVYQVSRPDDDRAYALKILLEKAASKPSVVDRFKREIKVATQLHHEAIVTVWDAGMTDDLYWMVMEFVEGRDLASWRGEPEHSLGEALQLMIRICDGVAHAHQRFIVHRDLKPGNIMITRPGDNPKICDFGLAKALSERNELTKTGDILGTPLYMAPEQAMGNKLLIGPPTDVWALGVMLYEMTTGRLPFTGKTTWKILEAVARQKPQTPAELGVAIPPPFEEIIMRCLEKEPTKRFREAGALAQALRELFE